MTRIGSSVLKISMLILFSANAAAGGTTSTVYPRLKKQDPKLDPNASCQMEMFLPDSGAELTAPPEDTRPDRIEDLTLMQGQMFDHFQRGEYAKGERLRKRLENQLLTSRLAKEPDAYVHSHELHRVSKVSFVLFRNEPAGGKETAGYDTVKAFGYPVQMPVTVPVVGGSLQVFHGYPNPPAKKTVPAPTPANPDAVKTVIPSLSIERINGEKRRQIQNQIADDPNQFIVDFLTLNKGRYAENVIFEPQRENPLIPYDFDDAFMAGPEANFAFFDYARSWFLTPELTADKNSKDEYYDHAKAILREQLSRSKFDWKKAVDKVNEDRLLELLKMRLMDNQAALQVRGQICALRAAIYNGDLRVCQKYGFNLTKGYRGPGYRQHDR